MEGQNPNVSAQSDTSLLKEKQDNQQDVTSAQSETVNKANQNQEESKISDQLANMSIKDEPVKKDKAVSQEEPIGKPYVLVHQSPKNWKIVIETLKSVQGKGKIDFQTMLDCIQTFVHRIEGNAGRNLDNLKAYFKNVNNGKKSELETRVFPTIVSLILETPKLFPGQLPLLVQYRGQKIKLSKRQCACLLSHMFMCTTLQQSSASTKMPSHYSFSEIFDKEQTCSDVKVAKIACVLNYFTRMSQEIRPTYVIFERLVLNETHGSCTLDAWRECADPVGRVEIRPQGKIEDAEGCIEIDFANKFLGGGVMRNGAAQEEIQFATSPELLIGVLFFEVMAEKEAILIKGSEIYCGYTGYLNKFRFSHDHRDEITATINDILEREVVAIDAINFKNPNALPQFSNDGVLRELNKAYIGFYGGENKKDKTVNKPISTGKWGCGVFKGDTQLKFVIQWLACSRAYRDMLFYSFGDHKEMKDAEVVLDYYKDKKVGKLVEDLLECCEKIDKSDRQEPKLFETLIKLKSMKKSES